MKMAFILFLFLFLFGSPASALPNAVLGFLAQHESPLNDQDLTASFLGGELWSGEESLPGEWESEAGVAGVKSAYLMARPKVFGMKALLVRSLRRGEKLEELQITFADAGSFFGFLDRRLPTGLSQEEGIAEMQKRLSAKQDEFGEIYGATLETLVKKLEAYDQRPKNSKRGRTRDLRANFTTYQLDETALSIDLLTAPDRLVRVSIRRSEDATRSWLDQSQDQLDGRERLKALADLVEKNDRGDVFLSGVEVVPQGYRPYCGLNTLVMVARYLGLHLDEDWLAVAGKFQNTGSAAGSDMLGLYSSVAKEAKFGLDRTSSYNNETVRRSIRAGMPVIVWRRWDQARDQLHTRVSRQVAQGKDASFERPAEESLPSKKKRSPLHASVIIGYNDDRKEVIFLESWDERARARRMPVSEIAHTADLTFSFKP